MTELTTRSIEERVHAILAEYSTDAISNGMSLVDDLDLDSMEMVDMATKLEFEFDIEIDDVDFEELNTVLDLVVYIQKRCL